MGHHYFSAALVNKKITLVVFAVWFGAAGFGTPLESLLLTLAMGAPLAGAFLVGHGSLGLVYGHAFVFDYLRAMGYSNVEIVSPRVFDAFPPLRYILYTPS